MEIHEITEYIKERQPELRNLGAQWFNSHIAQLWDGLFKDMISTIVISLNTMVWKYHDNLLENTNQAQIFAELWNNHAAFPLIGNICNVLWHYDDLSENEKQAINNIQRLLSLLTDLLKRNQFSLTIWDSTGTITIDSTENRKVLIFFLLEYWEHLNTLGKSLNNFIENQWCSETAEII